MTRTIVALAAALTLLLGGCTGSTSSEGGYISGDGSITRVAPDQRREAPVIDGTLLDGKPWSSTSVQGKVIVYNVWGSWCPPCQHEAPALVRAANRTTDTALFVGLNTRDAGKAQAEAFVRNYAVPYPNLFDPDGRLLLRFGNQLSPNSIPSTVVVDTQGRLAARVLGEATEATLVALIEEVAAGN